MEKIILESDAPEVKVIARCTICHHFVVVKVKRKDVQWLDEGVRRFHNVYMQDVLRYLTQADREIFISKMCGKCINEGEITPRNEMTEGDSELVRYIASLSPHFLAEDFADSIRRDYNVPGTKEKFMEIFKEEGQKCNTASTKKQFSQQR